LTGGSAEKGLDFSGVCSLRENAGVAFQGSQKIGTFEIPGNLARQWLQLPLNPNGRSNADVLKPCWIAIDLVRRPRDGWMIDFGLSMAEAEAALYEAPFAHVLKHVKPERVRNNREAYRRYWWRHGEPRVAMRAAISKFDRFIATPETSKHRLFAWLHQNILPDKKLIVIARDDDTMFGLLHSRVHELWALKMGSWHGVGNDPRYTPSTTFETFPFAEGLTPDVPAEQHADDPRAQKIAAAAKRLDELRNNCLNPPDLVVRVPEVVKGYPDRILPKDAAAAQVLKQRTLTNLYNERPSWLVNAHRDLDEAVAKAYGWRPDMSDDEMLTKLLALNLERAKEHPR
jgi:type II restriction/modification system DNA methylase subunit YeeA